MKEATREGSIPYLGALALEGEHSEIFQQLVMMSVTGMLGSSHPGKMPAVPDYRGLQDYPRHNNTTLKGQNDENRDSPHPQAQRAF